MPIKLDHWTKIKDSADWSARYVSRVISHAGHMWLTSGYDGTRPKDVWKSVNGIDWTLVTNTADWPGRSAHGFVYFNNKFWVMGGHDGSNFLNDIWSSSDAINWTLEAANADWSARHEFTVTELNGKLWVIGGFNSSGFPLKDVWSCTDPSGTWTHESDLPTTYGEGVREHATVVFQNKLWVLGGDTYIPGFGITMSNGIYSSPDGINWTPEGHADWQQRRELQAIVSSGGDEVAIIGGYSSTGDYLNDVWKSSNGVNWTQVSQSASFSARSDFSLVNHSGEVFLMGGRNSLTSLNDVWKATINQTSIVTDFSAIPTSGASPLSVDFTDLSSGITFNNSWLWSFGDTTTASIQNPSHVYTTAGSFTVTLENQLNWRDVAISDSGQYQTAVGSTSDWADGVIFGSSDFGITWHLRQTVSGKSLGHVRMSSDGSIQVANLLNTNYLYMSVDYGLSWDPITSAGTYNFYDVAISSTGQYITAAASGQFVHVSPDYGATWALKGTANIGIWIAMSSDGRYQIVAPGVGNISTSSDFGQNWTTRLYSHNYQRVAVSSSGQYQVAVTYDDGAGNFVYKSDDYGVTWAVASGYGTISNPGWNGVSISNDGQHILASEKYLWVSYDFGLNWTKKLSDVARSWKGVGIQNTLGSAIELACAETGSLYKSSDSGDTWNLTDTFSKTKTDYIIASETPTTGAPTTVAPTTATPTTASPTTATPTTAAPQSYTRTKIDYINVLAATTTAAPQIYGKGFVSEFLAIGSSFESLNNKQIFKQKTDHKALTLYEDLGLDFNYEIL